MPPRRSVPLAGLILVLAVALVLAVHHRSSRHGLHLAGGVDASGVLPPPGIVTTTTAYFPGPVTQ